MSLATLFEDIADAIREKDGTTDAIVANTFPARIQGIETGYKIDLSADPPEGGTVSGGGRASAGMMINVNVNLNGGNKFVGWYENGLKVYNRASFTFNVVRDMILKAIINVYDFWFNRTTLPNSTAWSDVAYGDGKFVAVAGGPNYTTSRFAYSTDGIKWTSIDLSTSVRYERVAYGGGKFVAIAGEESSNTSVAAYSTDGINWTETYLPKPAKWIGITYGDGKFVAIAGTRNVASSVAAYSTDGINWTETYLPISANWRGIAYGGDKFVAVAYNSSIAAYSAERNSG